MTSQFLESPTDILTELNPAQAEAVQATEGPVLVLAGPGSGKTRVLTHRIAYLIRSLGVPPHRILAVTFTNKAAREMTSRLEGLIGRDTQRLTIGTFHAICVRILRREADQMGLSRNFVIYDADDQERLVRRILKELNLDSKLYRPSAVHGAISRAKNELIGVQSYRPPTYWHEAVARVYERYEQVKDENSGLDFDDLLLKVEGLLRDNVEVRGRYQSRYQYLLVDEFQDTNKAQYEIVRHLAGDRRNVFVVGDEDQSIYSWRGADFRNVVRFRADFSDAQLRLLEQNYRSTQTILDAAQAIISHNAQRTVKKLWTDNKMGVPIQTFEAYDEREEAEYVLGEIERSIARGRARLSDCAVMYRTNAQSRALEDAFMRHGLPYRLVGGQRFYQRREIKDILSYLRVIQNPSDDVSLLRIINVPRRGIGAKTIAELSAWAAQLGLSSGDALLHLAGLAKDGRGLDRVPLSGRSCRLLLGVGELLGGLSDIGERTLGELLQAVVDKIEYVAYLRDGTEEGEERINNVRELFTAVERYEGTSTETALASFLEEVALATDVDQTDWETDAATLLTLHSAKGLEFYTVFIVGLEEGICPHSRSLDEPDAMEEERRLCYVGVTRARSNLYLVHAFRRSLYGNSEARDPSRFLLDIPESLIDRKTARRSRPGGASQSSSTSAGRRNLFADRRARVRRAQGGLASGKGSETQGTAVPTHSTVRLPDPVKPARPQRTHAEFGPGDSVTHPIFGTGMVIESKIQGDDEEVTVAFEGRGIKRLLASYAKLDKLS